MSNYLSHETPFPRRSGRQRLEGNRASTSRRSGSVRPGRQEGGSGLHESFGATDFRKDLPNVTIPGPGHPRRRRRHRPIRGIGSTHSCCHRPQPTWSSFKVLPTGATSAMRRPSIPTGPEHRELRTWPRSRRSDLGAGTDIVHDAVGQRAPAGPGIGRGVRQGQGGAGRRRASGRHNASRRLVRPRN